MCLQATDLVSTLSLQDRGLHYDSDASKPRQLWSCGFLLTGSAVGQHWGSEMSHGKAGSRPSHFFQGPHKSNQQLEIVSGSHSLSISPGAQDSQAKQGPLPFLGHLSTDEGMRASFFHGSWLGTSQICLQGRV